MKKFKRRPFCLFLCCLLFLLFLPSCRKNSADDVSIDSIISKTTQPAEELRDDVYPLPDWLSPELEYHNAGGDTCRGIRYLNGRREAIFRNNQLYFETNSSIGSAGNIQMWNTVNLETGAFQQLCPDPLCSHDAGSGCLLYQLESLIASPDNPQLLYGVRTQNTEAGVYSVLLEIDLAQMRSRVLYSTQDALQKKDDEVGAMGVITLQDVADGKAEFVVYRSVNIVRDNGETERDTKQTALTYDLASDTCTEAQERDGLPAHSFLQTDSHTFYLQNRAIVALDRTTGEIQTLYAVADTENLTGLTYDTVSGTLYFLLHSGEGEAYRAELHCIEQDFTEHIVPMSSDRILDFQLTDRFIYYTRYDPAVIGKAMRGDEDYTEESGGKIYRAARGDSTREELVFDTRLELFYSNAFFVSGDCLYLNYNEMAKNASGKLYFVDKHITLRINFAENTYKWLQ